MWDGSFLMPCWWCTMDVVCQHDTASCLAWGHLAWPGGTPHSSCLAWGARLTHLAWPGGTPHPSCLAWGHASPILPGLGACLTHLAWPGGHASPILPGLGGMPHPSCLAWGARLTHLAWPGGTPHPSCLAWGHASPILPGLGACLTQKGQSALKSGVSEDCIASPLMHSQQLQAFSSNTLPCHAMRGRAIVYAH